MGKRIVKQRITWQGPVVTVEYPTINKKLSTDTSKHPEAVQEEARCHGYTQKYGDAKSGESPQEKFEMVQRLIASHEGGNWDLTDRTIDPVRVFEAIARIKDVEVDDVRDAVEAMGDDAEDFVKKARNDPQIKVVMAEINAERLREQVTETSDSVLSKLGF